MVIGIIGLTQYPLYSGNAGVGIGAGLAGFAIGRMSAPQAQPQYVERQVIVDRPVPVQSSNQQKIRNLEKELDAVYDDLDETRAQLQELRQERRTLKEEKNRLQQEVNRLKKELEKKDVQVVSAPADAKEKTASTETMSQEKVQ
jgi:peptidoglycan hydrolase CwlO-like protein